MKSTLKAVYSAVSLIAVLNCLALLGVGAYVMGTGRLHPERIERLQAAWADPAPASQPAVVDDDGMQAATQPGRSAEIIARDALESEMLWRERERIRSELDQKLQTIRAASIRVSQRQEAFEESQRREAERQRKLAELKQPDGYAKQLEILKTLAPKKAVEFLANQPPADSARMLLELPSTRAKEIYEAARSKTEKARMNEVFALMRSINGEAQKPAPEN